jgi:hypothetical protein
MSKEVVTGSDSAAVRAAEATALLTEGAQRFALQTPVGSVATRGSVSYPSRS